MINQDDIKKKQATIQEDIANHKIVLYMKGHKTMPMCGFSGQVIHILNQIGAPFETRNVLEDEVLREAIKVFSDWPTIPQLYVNGEFIGGCDIIIELYESGDLMTQLA